MKVPRTQKLAGEFQKEISKIISGELKNRELSLSGIISVTEVDVAPDLKTAKVFISIYTKDPEKKQQSYEIIKANAPYIRHLLSERMYIRTVPALTFLLDGSFEYGARIDELLKQVEKDLPEKEEKSEEDKDEGNS